MWYFASGDSRYYFIEQLQSISWLPKPWSMDVGFGFPMLARMWFDYPHDLTIKLLSFIGLSWWWIDKLLWVAVFVLAVYSSFRIARYVLGDSISAIFASIIYTTNTYFLLLFSGGQVGVASAFGFAPIVLLKFMEVMGAPSKTPIRRSLVNGLCMALLISFDLRVAYLVGMGIGIYFLFRPVHVIRTLLVPIVVAGLLHSFWILPLVVAGGGAASLGEQFTNPGMLKFLSVADFSHALSLLHPNWPENLFGRVYFLQPEFLVLPLIAFTALLLVKAEKKTHILFFALLAILGAFFAKGVQAPFGGIFQWMFTHVPGFVMFRDPTKFYVFTAISYSILIPFTLDKFIQKLRITNSGLRITIYIVFIAFWCFTIRAVFVGQVKGNFRPLTLTPEYLQLKNILVHDTKPSRVLWIPKTDKFAYFSDIHPVLSSDQLFQNASVSAVIAMIGSSRFDQVIRQSGIGYVIVPEDLEKNMFLTDYRFDRTIRDRLIAALNASSLRPLGGYEDLKVYQSEHDPMQVIIPKNVARQQHWSNTGLIISMLSFVVSVGYLAVRRKKS